MDLFPTWVLLFTALALGLRHGLDWDHISAIMDITSGQRRARQGVALGWFYAAGHGTVVGALGSAAILIGLRLSPAVDQVMAYIVGASLIVLGLYVMSQLIRHPGEEFQMRSRWVLLAAAVRYVGRRLITRITSRRPADRPPRPQVYGPVTAYAIGIIHGTGGETPTQILLFLLAGGTGSGSVGIPVVLLFILGVFITNTVESVFAAIGYSRSADYPRLFQRVAGGAAAISLAIGTLFLGGAAGLLPSLG
jgi:high-affinity nickel-transport protein